ncbi:efflux RND transporter periplasmic adaptor subunit [Adhaeribacter soli]|uniref:HlyD family efflux transporter periplasmic adaptor subunit n=1 Tax=Adhaeribacter soli TaxID=2607655 RepID=A0A5N1IK67_9BACT|nr:HlyD family efflux transporter periplasmic adaptor subunit [Adhaeribacter soli]KAA9325669.1 HlyD family efflux transporter periplasmic adaptor subunit [Adhaeribacter soli]
MRKYLTFFSFVLPFFLAGCKQTTPGTEGEEATGKVKTPVQVITVEHAPIAETLTLSATSVYQKKNILNANVQGYIKKIYVNLGDFVTAGKPMFLLHTKEAEVLGDLAKKDPALAPFSGGITVKAPASGNVQQINFQQNDYVNEGDKLAIIADESSFVFLLNVPFEFSKYTAIGTGCTIFLPDSTSIPGKIKSSLGVVDTGSQTQRYVVVPLTNRRLPENLQVNVQLTKEQKPNSQVVDKAAVLSDETMENFWVMKLINDSTAVKVPVKKGIVSGQKIEILSPRFKPTDRLVTTGNYGLPDTALVTVLKPKP